MDYKEKEISFSCSCLPPDIEAVCGDIQTTSDVPQTVVKFPTLFGKSLGFTKLMEVDYSPVYKDQHSSRPSKSTKLTRRSLSISGPSNVYTKNMDNCYTLKQICTKNNFDSMDLNQRVFYYNLPPSLPKNYNPRSVKRSRSFNRTMMQLTNTNNSNCVMVTEPELDLSRLNMNVNNSNDATEEPVEVWIDLYFQFPDGHRMKFRTRRSAPLKHSLTAFSARMGYTSIYDLCFKTQKGELVNQNDTPRSLELTPGDSITVENTTD